MFQPGDAGFRNHPQYHPHLGFLLSHLRGVLLGRLARAELGQPLRLGLATSKGGRWRGEEGRGTATSAN